MSANFTQQSAQPRRSDWSALGRLAPYLLKFKARVSLAMSLLLLAKLATVGMPIALKYIVDSLDVTLNPVVVLPLSMLIAYGVMRLASTLLGELRDVIFGRVTEQAIHAVALKVFKHVHALDMQFHLDRRTGGMSRDIERGLSGIDFLMRFMLFNIVPTFLEIGLVAIILFVGYGWSFATITLVSVVIYIAFSVIATEWRTAFVREANKMDSAANSRAIDSLLNFETVKYFNNEAFEAENYDENLTSWEAAIRKNRLSLGSLNSGQSLIIAMAASAMLVLAAQGVANGEMTLGDLVLINSYIMQLFMPLGFLGFVYREIKSSLANISRMFALLDNKPAVVDIGDAAPLDVSNAEIRFNNVEFSYRPDRPILRGVDFTIKPGQTVAVVGASGAGKSTISRLLFRFYDVASGSIEIDGQAIDQVQQASLRKAIGVVPQDTVLFNNTIEYNIRYGRPEASDEEVRDAAKLAHLSEFVDNLPDGYQTNVGERGLKVSGGEKQRIAIARTILKNPPILIFDEATSSLDSHSERAILDAFKDVAKSRTTLVIAHRLSTVVDADQIVVLEQGAVAEAGTHQQLLAADGRYAHLWRIQNADHAQGTEADGNQVAS
ncbi:MAG: ABC-type transport system involved in Fe-S cluster assembly fused permease/ATPase subunit [Pseudoalteromonas tetraodonis]|jgi:ABC-type transport system involved in Fe-S cluster assembly fused permease/ATPase subunit